MNKVTIILLFSIGCSILSMITKNIVSKVSLILLASNLIVIALITKVLQLKSEDKSI